MSDPFAVAREEMVEQQLKADGRITDPRVLAAMAKVPRHEFVPRHLQSDAYRNSALPIGYQQTISQPFIVAFMTELLASKSADRVLEVGTGCGYQAAILSEIVSEVFTMEIIEPLARTAEANLRRLGFNEVKVRAGDGHQGWFEAAPFDAIIVACAPDRIPPELVDQLKDGGRMIIPVGPPTDQNLYQLEKHGNSTDVQSMLPVRFVPMTSVNSKS